MTNDRPPRTAPRGSPAAEREELADRVRLARVLAFASIVVAIVALGIAAWALLGARSSCQDRAWGVAPAQRDLPEGWTSVATTYDINRRTTSFLGPVPADASANQAQAYVTVSCFEQGASEAVDRSQAASQDAGQTVEVRDDLGDQAFSAVASTGERFVQLRSGSVVVFIASSRDATATEVDQLASAFDRALGGDGGTIATPGPATPAPSDDTGAATPGPGDSAEPGVTPAAPELEALLPTEVDGVTLAVQSYTGADGLGDDPGSRAILASLRDAGRTAADLHVAVAADPKQQADVLIEAFSVTGLSAARTRTLVTDTVLLAGGPGIKRESVTLGGATWERIDAGTGGRVDWVRAIGDAVVVIETADETLAEAAAAAMP